MENPFFDYPIINSPYAYPSQHWELDEEGQPLPSAPVWLSGQAPLSQQAWVLR